MCNKMEWHREKYWTHEEREVQKGMETQDTSWNLSVIKNKFWP